MHTARTKLSLQDQKFKSMCLFLVGDLGGDLRGLSFPGAGFGVGCGSRGRIVHCGLQDSIVSMDS